MEVRLGKSDRRGMVAISGYFWFAAAISGYFWLAAAISGLQRRDRFVVGFV